MKIIVDKYQPKDNEYLPYVGEEIMTPNEYVNDFIKKNGFNYAEIRRNSIWMFLFIQGVSNNDIDWALLNNGI